MIKKKFSAKDSPPMLTLLKNKNLSGVDLTTVKLPQDLSDTNLTNANLAGHHFSHTNFTGAQLSGVILTNTTCDYQQCFQDNMLTNKLSEDIWFLDYLPEDLTSIAQVYPKLSEDKHKAALLQIACGLAYLPYYKNKEFHIQVEYWSCKLLMLKKQLAHLGSALVCTLASELKDEAENYCWQTDYPYPAHLEHSKGMQIARQWCILSTHSHLPKELSRLIQYYLTEPPQQLHANFDQYLQLFQEGLCKYNVKSKEKWGDKYYKEAIERNIKGLKKAYPKLISKKRQKEAMEIAQQLSQQYKVQHWCFFSSFLHCQHRLIRLKSSAQGALAERNEVSVGVEVKNDIYYEQSTFNVFLPFYHWH